MNEKDKTLRMLSVRIEDSLVDDLKVLGIRTKRSLQSLVEEAARDLLQKYKADEK